MVEKERATLHESHITTEESGERGRNRTSNLLIKSQLLCQLSYAPTFEREQYGEKLIIASQFRVYSGELRVASGERAKPTPTAKC